MTVAAVILSATPDGAVADTLGQPRVRRLVDTAWSGGAMPIVVVSPDPDGAVAKALVGSEAVHEEPAPPERGPAGQMARGADRAMADVSGVTAVLLWPARLAWVGPETVTSLIETHGVESASMLRPSWHGEVGWPVLLPTNHLDALRGVAADLMPPSIIEALAHVVPTSDLELGDPGVVHDVETPFAELPAYEGPTEPPGGHTHEWGVDVETEAGLQTDLTETDDPEAPGI